MCFISRIRWGQFIVCLHYAMPEASGIGYTGSVSLGHREPKFLTRHAAHTLLFCSLILSQPLLVISIGSTHGLDLKQVILKMFKPKIFCEIYIFLFCFALGIVENFVSLIF